MANIVTCTVMVFGADADVALFREKCFSTEAYGLQFDFNRIVPMPKILEDVVENGGLDARLVLYAGHNEDAPYADHADYWMQKFRSELDMKSAPVADVATEYLRLNPEARQRGILRIRAILETGYAGWYQWRCKHWGTKWNAGVATLHSEHPLKFSFDCAWNPPHPIYRAIEEIFPTLNFNYEEVPEIGEEAAHA